MGNDRANSGYPHADTRFHRQAECPCHTPSTFFSERKNIRHVLLPARQICTCICLEFSFDRKPYERNFYQPLLRESSLELVANKKNKVTKVIGKNEDAVAIIDDMNLKNVDLNIAVNALIGSMLKHGYLQDDENIVLVSVSSRDQKKAKQIQNDIEEDFTSSLAVIDKEATVIKQDIIKDSSLSKQSSEYGISEGKMQFINELLALDPSLNSNVLAAMSINELASLAKQYHMIPETDTSPSPSITGTTTEEKKEDKKKPASADSDPEDSKKEENADNITSDEETDDTEDSEDEDFPDEEDDDSSSGKIDQKSDTTEAPSSPNTINEDEEPDTNNDQTNRPITLD